MCVGRGGGGGGGFQVARRYTKFDNMFHGFEPIKTKKKIEGKNGKSCRSKLDEVGRRGRKCKKL